MNLEFICKEREPYNEFKLEYSMGEYLGSLLLGGHLPQNFLDSSQKKIYSERNTLTSISQKKFLTSIYFQ